MKQSLVLVAMALWAQPPADFSGTWRYVKEQSRIQGSGPDSLVMAIEQSGGKMHQRMIALTKGREDRLEFNFSLDGPSVNSMRGMRLDSQSSWEGGTIIIASKALPQGQPMSVTERYSVSG